jgi:hypothetical protein
MYTFSFILGYCRFAFVIFESCEGPKLTMSRVNKMGVYHTCQSGIQISDRNSERDQLLSSEVPVYLGQFRIEHI